MKSFILIHPNQFQEMMEEIKDKIDTIEYLLKDEQKSFKIHSINTLIECIRGDISSTYRYIHSLALIDPPNEDKEVECP